MLKKDLIDAVAGSTLVPKKSVRAVLDAAGAAACTALEGGQSVMLLGVGKLSITQRGPKQARNLRTGERIVVPPRRVVVFTCADGLSKLVNGRA